MQEDELKRGNRQEAGAQAEKGQGQQTREGPEEHTHKKTRLAVDPRPLEQQRYNKLDANRHVLQRRVARNMMFRQDWSFTASCIKSFSNPHTHFILRHRNKSRERESST
jgi:hypothetical protein